MGNALLEPDRITHHSSPITVVCVEWGNYLGRPIEYIEKLRAGVARHLRARHWFVALRLGAQDGGRRTADEHNPSVVGRQSSGFTGWFQKLEIFRPGRFTGRCLYLDLDSVIVGPLDPLVYRKGAVHTADWGWARNVHAGGTLVWDAEIEGRRIWDAWTPDVPSKFENDQEWMTALGVWEPLPAQLVRSYRYHCAERKSEGGGRKAEGPPDGCAVVAFHGLPKPHEVGDRWVLENWRQ